MGGGGGTKFKKNGSNTGLCIKSVPWRSTAQRQPLLQNPIDRSCFFIRTFLSQASEFQHSKSRALLTFWWIDDHAGNIIIPKIVPSVCAEKTVF